MIQSNDKIISLEGYKKIKREVVVLCHGHFNIIHPGHIRYLDFAHTKGGKLLVSLEGEHFFEGFSRNNSYSEAERAAGVASMEKVDQVILLGDKSLEDAVKTIEPDFLVLGKEFEYERYEQIHKAAEYLESLGGQILFHAGESHYASSKLLEESQSEIQKQRNKQFQEALAKQKISLESLRKCLKDFQKVSLLVIGDTIMDQYVACDALGMSAEAPVIVARELESKKYLGGAGIVALHAKALGAKCSFLSVVGDDQDANLVKERLEFQKVESLVFADESRPTTVKTRYMVDNQKLFRLSRLKEHGIPKAIERSLIEELKKQAPVIGGILICDFVYGVITPMILETIVKLASQHNLLLFGDLQCSSQVGNVAKFNNFDLVCPTEREARIALGVQNEGIEWVANTLMEKTRSKNLILKLGSEGFIAYASQSDGFFKRQHFPALNPNPIDVAGAGDSLLAALSVGLCAGSSIMEASALGSVMASLAVQTMGNVPVTQNAILNSILNMDIN